MYQPFRSSSLEAIAFQPNSIFFKELTLIFDGLSKLDEPTKKDFKATGIEKLVKDTLGIKIAVDIDPTPIPNAYVCPPQIDKNHPLIVNYMRYDKGSSDGLAGISVNGGILTGQIDLRTGYISGPIADIECDLFVTLGLLKISTFSAAERAAIFLHELGHINTYIEYLVHAVTANYVLQAVARGWAQTDVMVKRIQIVRDAEKALKLSQDDAETLAGNQSSEIVQTLLLSKAIEASRSELGSSIYDMRGWEALSDQFATRYGAGRDLATGLDKIMRIVGHSSYYGTATFMAIEAAKLTAWIGITFAGFIPLSVLILMFNPNARLYDEPGERFTRIRGQLVEALKSKTISTKYRNSLLSDIEAIDQLLEPINDRRGILELFWTTIIPEGRRQYNQQQLQQDLEAMALNDLFTASAKLKSIK